MVKRYYAEQCEKEGEVQYVTFSDYDWERAKVDRLQNALREAVVMIAETTQERVRRCEELRALANMKRSELKDSLR